MSGSFHFCPQPKEQYGNTNQYFYTRAHFNALAKAQQESIDQLFLYIGSHTLSGCSACDDERVHEYLNIYRPVEGCVPLEVIDDNSTEAVRSKFRFMYGAATEWAERELVSRGKRLHEDFSFALVIDASTTDSTVITIVDFKKPIAYIHERHKAWHYQFESMALVADEVLRIKNLLVNKVLEKRQIFLVVKDGGPDNVQYPADCPFRVAVVDYQIEELDPDCLDISPIDGEACILTEF